jgi:type IV secretory pathway VirB2 component (pilin)
MFQNVFNKVFRSGRRQEATDVARGDVRCEYVAQGSGQSAAGSGRLWKVSRAKMSLVVFHMALIASETSFASRLEEAAQRGQSLVISIGQITAVIGIVLGGIAMSIGLAMVGRGMLISGVIGAAATFGGPAVIDMLKEIFR